MNEFIFLRFLKNMMSITWENVEAECKGGEVRRHITYSFNGDILRKKSRYEFPDRVSYYELEECWFEDNPKQRLLTRFYRDNILLNHQRWHGNGQLWEDQPHDWNGKPKGIWKTYYPNGQIELIVNHDSIPATTQQFWENGQIREQTVVEKL